jgi:hypothetical protein
MEVFMKDPVQICMARLKSLAQTGNTDLQPSAAKVVQEFLATAKKSDRARLKMALEDARIVGMNTEVAPRFLPEHARWLATLEGARAVG